MVHVHGRYTERCCPEYPKPDNFAALKGNAGQGGLAERLSPHTAIVSQFLAGSGHRFAKHLLLDHMDRIAKGMGIAGRRSGGAGRGQRRFE
jgi:S-adenosylmethionine-diacylglycerol 3-amino-3-carboxypropyl transferase